MCLVLHLIIPTPRVEQLNCNPDKNQQLLTLAGPAGGIVHHRSRVGAESIECCEGDVGIAGLR